MRPLGPPVRADENIHPGVVTARRARGCDVRTVLEAGLGGAADVLVLRAASADRRVVLTHDADFGTLALGPANRSWGSCTYGRVTSFRASCSR
jgi:predicted nuclease of predicted toxin-antitoxin system